MIRVEVRLYASLRDYAPAGGGDRVMLRDLDDGATVEQLYGVLEIPLEEVVVSLVNGRAEALDHTLEDGDRIDVFPPLAGG